MRPQLWAVGNWHLVCSRAKPQGCSKAAPGVKVNEVTARHPGEAGLEPVVLTGAACPAAGSSLVDWLLSSGFAASRLEAVAAGLGAHGGELPSASRHPKHGSHSLGRSV